jgi:hypothetical protein
MEFKYNGRKMYRKPHDRVLEALGNDMQSKGCMFRAHRVNNRVSHCEVVTPSGRRFQKSCERGREQETFERLVDVGYDTI